MSVYLVQCSIGALDKVYIVNARSTGGALETVNEYRTRRALSAFDASKVRQIGNTFTGLAGIVDQYTVRY